MVDSESEASFGPHGETGSTETSGSFLYTGAAGVAGGFVGGVAMGVILHVGGNLMPFIGSLYGWPSVIGGWAAHMINSILIGLLFAVLLFHPVIRKRTTSLSECLVFSIVYAAAVGLVTGGLMLPISMTMIGATTFPQSLLPVPDVLGSSFVAISIAIAHAVYGLLLGATYGVINNTIPKSQLRG